MNTDQKYQSILNLTRAGSTQFALSEYKRLGLDIVRHHEDIMALHGRLYKDVYLSKSGGAAREAARLSAEKYEAAFQDTNGFYSGINAATMSLLAGFDPDMVHMRAKRIIEILPQTGALDSETKYFIEATRAEGFLLLEKKQDALRSLTAAWDHDPLNYISHASTLKQFRLISKHRNEKLNWLDDFTSPKAMHFAGHIFAENSADAALPALSDDQVADLKGRIREAIQSHDIGFGFGSLAAGSDILIAETILEEGAELHVTLPVPVEVFTEQSVVPFGASWYERFDACLESAESFTIMSDFEDWPNFHLDRQASLTSMGAAIRRAELLSVPSMQLLVWDEKDHTSATSRDASDWLRSGRSQIIIPYPDTRDFVSEVNSVNSFALKTCVTDSKLNDLHVFDDFTEALEHVIRCRTDQPELRQGLSLEIIPSGFQPSDLSKTLCDRAMLGSIVVSQLAANFLAFNHSEAYKTNLIGHLDDNEQFYAIQEITG